MSPKISIYINTVKIPIRGLCIIIDGLTADGPDCGQGERVSGALRVLVDCSGTRGLSLVGATGCSAITYRLKT